MRWQVHGERPIYESPWVNLWLADVQEPDGSRYDHHVVRMRHLAVAAVVDADERVLMLWRHRFVTDTWGWELPMGLIEPGETPIEAAARETLEETGWQPQPLRPLVYAQLANGITDSEHFLFRADGATYQGPPTEVNEADRIEWVPIADLRGMIDRRDIVSSATIMGVLYLLLDQTSRPFAITPTT
jgi:8-oxo-dGTP pyrophosphatase MutT (NUDIX family)